MIGLGSDGSEPSFDSGIHLRWHAALDLGFPRFGFDLYRRQAAEPEFDCVDLEGLRWTSTLPSVKLPSAGLGGAILGAVGGALRSAKITTHTATFMGASLASTAAFSYKLRWGPANDDAIVAKTPGTLTLTTTRAWREFRLSAAVRGGSLTVKAYDRDGLVAQETRAASTTAMSIVIRADRFDKIKISWEGACGFYRLCWSWLPKDEQPGLSWALLGNFRLPGIKTVALGRIASPRPHTGKDYAAAWEPMRRVVQMTRTGDETITADSYGDGTGAVPTPAPTYTIKAVETLNLMSMVDSGLARMIGLYYIDTTAAPGSTYDYMIVGRWTAGRIGDERWVCYGQRMYRPPAVPVPTGLTVKSKTWIGGSSTTQTGCGLTWDTENADAPVASRMPVFFNVYRKAKSGGTWGAESKLTDGRPVMISLKDGAAPSSFYTDGPLADGEYGYVISGVDLFGRESAKSAPATITLADEVAPPPPTDVKAKLDDDSKDVAVQWKWPEQRQEIAGDADHFVLYWQTEDINPETLHLTAVTDAGDASDCETDLDAAGDWSRFGDGYLVNRGRRFRVTRIVVSGGKVVLTVENIAATETRAKQVPTPVASSGYGGFLLYTPTPGNLQGKSMLIVDWSDPSHWNAVSSTVPVTSSEEYSSTISALPVTVDAATPVAYAIVGVSTVDRTGNVGAVSVPVMVSARKTDTPATPDAPWSEMDGSEPEYASYPDWYGTSRFSLGFDTDADYYYDVMRATDAAVVFAAHGRGKTVDEVDDAELASLAGSNDSAFVSVGARDADGNLIAGDGASKTHEDSFPGTGRNRYLYRIACYDKAGNRSAMSDALVVLLHDVTPPKPPVLTKIYGGDRQITLQWAKNREGDFLEKSGAVYRLYRTEAEEDADDVRGMALVTEIAEGIETYTDSVAGLTDYWYRLTAVDENGNESASGGARKAKAYDHSTPAEPTWVRSEWVKIDDDGNEYAYDDTTGGLTDAVALEFTVSNGGLSALIQREDANGDWKSVTSWTTDDDSLSFTLYDTTAAADEDNTYRAKLTSAAAQTLESTHERAVVAVA